MNVRFRLSKINWLVISKKTKDITKDILFQRHKINEIIRKFLLARNKFMSEMNLRQSGITYNACEPFTKNNKKIRKCKGTGDSRSI